MTIVTLPYGNTLSDAFAYAKSRGILPTWMGAAELRELEQGLRERAVFSARTTDADYLQTLREQLNKLVEGGYGSTEAEIRVALKNKLRELGYDPLTGFAGDAELGIPPARPGSLQDLGSDRRLNLIIDTQTQLIAGKGQQQRGMEPAALDMFPAYEFVRIKSVRTAREWLKQWSDAADNVDWAGVSQDALDTGRMVALKTSPIWPAIGSTALFDDALDVSHPPFRFNSGMGWSEVERAEAEKLGLGEVTGTTQARKDATKLPPAVASTNGLDDDFLRALEAKVTKAELADGTLTLKGSVDNAVQRALKARQARMNALCDDLDDITLRLNAGTRGGALKGWATRRSGARAQAEKGKTAMDKVIADQADVLNAMEVPDLGPVDFRWKVGERGIRRIHEDHKIARRIPMLLALGKVTKAKSRAFVEHRGHVVVLVNDYFGTPSNHWVLTGYKDKLKRRPKSP